MAESEDYEEVVVEETKLVVEATQLLRSLRMKKLEAARLSKIGECQSWASWMAELEASAEGQDG